MSRMDETEFARNGIYTSSVEMGGPQSCDENAPKTKTDIQLQSHAHEDQHTAYYEASHPQASDCRVS